MIAQAIHTIKDELPQGVKLVAVSKFHPAEAIREAYDAGQRLFGESRPQEFEAKARMLPEDIEWHFIGHLQTNKLKMVLPYVSMVQSVDSGHLLEAIDKWCRANGKVMDVLLELHLGAEETKQGFMAGEIESILSERQAFAGVRFRGLMGMATNTDDESLIRADFARISSFFQQLRSKFPIFSEFNELSIGMSHDWKIAVEYGATYIRVGTSIFGERKY